MSTKPMQVRDAAAHYAAQAEGQDVPPGYKRTEVGVIPEDWEAVPMGQLAKIQRGASPRPIDSPIWFEAQSSIGWLRISDVTRANKYLSETLQNLSELGVAHSRFVASGNLVMSICATVGRPIILHKNVCIHDGFVVFSEPKADIEFLYYVLTDLEPKWSKHGQTGSQMNLNTGLINDTPVPLPPPSEQRAIATALSDVDALLTALDKLIAKKRAIKTAAMQQLLTGKTRLPGFSGEWEVKQLGDVCSITTGRKDVNEGNARGQYPFFTCSKNHTYSDSYSFNTEAILVAGNGDVGNLHYCSGKFEAYQRTYVLYDFSINVKYFWYQLDQFLLSSLGVGTIGTSIPYIKMENLRGFIFSTPQDPKEQTAIAQVLSDMDAEIAALEKRRAKTRAIKQGMMQELLTGRTRLV